jgi:ribonuclease T2
MHGMRVRKPVRILWVAVATCVAVVALSTVATIAQARHRHRNDHQGEAGVFDYYLLSLSWAPTYCLTHSDDGAECSNKGYGFVLHGLWPQYDAGGYPEKCQTDNQLSEEAVAKGRTIYPSPRLMAHEWQTHGTCSGLSALEYFRTADRATAAVKIPAQFEAPRSDLAFGAGQVLDLFRSANPGLPASSVTVACSRATVTEVRVCLTKDLAVRSCGRGVRTTCPDVTLRIPASR